MTQCDILLLTFISNTSKYHTKICSSDDCVALRDLSKLMTKWADFLMLSIKMFLKEGPSPKLTKYHSLSGPRWYFLVIFESRNTDKNKQLQSALEFFEYPAMTDFKVHCISTSLTAEFVTISSILPWCWGRWQCDANVWVLVGDVELLQTLLIFFALASWQQPWKCQPSANFSNKRYG